MSLSDFAISSVNHTQLMTDAELCSQGSWLVISRCNNTQLKARTSLHSLIIPRSTPELLRSSRRLCDIYVDIDADIDADADILLLLLDLDDVDDFVLDLDDLTLLLDLDLTLLLDLDLTLLLDLEDLTLLWEILDDFNDFALFTDLELAGVTEEAAEALPLCLSENVKVAKLYG